MRFLLVVFCLFFTFSLQADEGAFAAKKERAIEKLEKRIQSLNTLMGCIQSASDKQALKACRKTHKESMHALKKEKDK